MTEVNSELERAKKTPQTRVEAAMAFALSGASFAEIARLLEYDSPSAAKNAVERMLASTVTISEKNSLRKVAAARYELLLKSVMPRATNPKDSSQLAFNQRAHALIDKIVRLHGLEAPQQVQITPSDQYLAEYTNRIKASMGIDVDLDPEADILDEPGEDEAGYGG